MPPRLLLRALLSTAALTALVVVPGLTSCAVAPATAHVASGDAASAPDEVSARGRGEVPEEVPARGHGEAPDEVSARGHGEAAVEARLRREEVRTLGPRHAAEHAAQRRGLRRWRRMSPYARERARRVARRAASRSGSSGPADQVGRWSSTTYPMPQWALNAVVLPTGKVAYWGRAALGTAVDGNRDNAGMFYLWDPATGQSVEHPPPDVFFDRDADGIEDDWGPAPLFCSGQSLLPSGELYVAGGNRFAPGVRASGGPNPEYAGWWGTYSFDPWTERWTVQPSMSHGRWYPTQVELPDGRIAITSGYDENGAGADNDTMEIFTPSAQRGGVGTLATVPSGFHDTDGFYPHMQVVPGGNVLLAGPGQNDSSLLDPARLGQPGSGSAWIPHGWTSRYRIGSSAALLPPAAPGSGSSKLMLLGGHRGEDLNPATGLEQSTAVVETTDVALGSPGWRFGRPGEPPALDQPRSYGNLVQLPTGGFAYLGGAAGFRRASPAPGYSGPGTFGPEGSNATMGKQDLKSVALWDPGQSAWRRGPASRKWRSYHSTAVLLPDGRVLSAGDDYWGMDDLPHTGFESPQDHAEIYEPAYLFDGEARAPRPSVTAGPAAVRWGDDFGLRVAEVAGRPITRVTLVGPPAVTHAVDMNRKFAELPIVERVPGVGVNVVAPTGADLAPPGWYMLFAVDATGTPAVAHWVQITGDAADAPRVVADGGGSGGGDGGAGGGSGGAGAGGPSGPARPPGGAPAPGSPLRDVRGPRVGLVVRRPKRASTSLSIRLGADEPARLWLRFQIQGRATRRTLRLTTRRLSRSIRVRLARSERARLRRGQSLRLRVRTTARDSAGNSARRSLRMVVRAGRATRVG